MPSISTMLYPTPGYVRVEINWADVTQATAAAVYRVDCETGARTPLRPYVSYNGDYLTLSCGQAIFWDTEAPLDRCFYYCTQAIDSSGTVVTTAADPLIVDTFSRTVAAGSWGTANTGQVWTIATGTATDSSVTGTRGRMGITTVNQIHRNAIDGPLLNAGALVTFIPNVLATGAAIDMNTVLRRDEASNSDYRLDVIFQTTGQVDLVIERNVAGVFTTIGSVASVLPYTAATQVQARFEVWGSLIRGRIWDATSPEPSAWQINATDASPYMVPGVVNLRGLLRAGNTNTLPVNLEFDNFTVYDPCDTTQVVENCSDDLIAPSSGDWRLGDPVRPCNDRLVRNGEGTDPDCVPTQGIFFANMSADESFPAQSGAFLPTNSRYPIVVNRQRQAITATLTTVTRTFNDRDDIRTLTSPGSPLFLRGPAQYGIADRYMAISDVAEHRPVSDHTVQPRSIVLPHAEVARPSGPTQGICGAQVDDLCDIYATWDALAASGLTWADLLRGKASNDTPIPDTVERTWNDVNAGYADWTAVNAGNTDWDDLLDGA